MVNSTAVIKGKPSLNGMVFCANCGSEMANTGRRYYCPNTTVASGRNCPTRPVDALHLLRTVVFRMASRLTSEDMIQNVTQDIKDTTSANARIQRRRMEQAEAAITDTKVRSGMTPTSVEKGASSHDETAGQITDLDQATAGLGFEAIVARNELDKIEFISDEVGTRDTLTDPETYMGANSPEDAQELLDLIIRKVAVDTGSAIIVYQEAMPSKDHPQGILEDLVPIDRPATS